MRPVEINPLDSGTVSVTLVLVNIVTALSIISVEQVDILIIVASNQLSPIITDHSD